MQVLTQKRKSTTSHNLTGHTCTFFENISIVSKVLYLLHQNCKQKLLVTLSTTFSMRKITFIARSYNCFYSKQEECNYPCLTQAQVFRCTTTQSCDSQPSFVVLFLQLKDHGLAIFELYIVVEAYQNTEEMFATTPMSVINIELLYPSSSPFATEVHIYLRMYHSQTEVKITKNIQQQSTVKVQQ